MSLRQARFVFFLEAGRPRKQAALHPCPAYACCGEAATRCAAVHTTLRKPPQRATFRGAMLSEAKPLHTTVAICKLWPTEYCWRAEIFREPRMSLTIALFLLWAKSCSTGQKVPVARLVASGRECMANTAALFQIGAELGRGPRGTGDPRVSMREASAGAPHARSRLPRPAACTHDPLQMQQGAKTDKNGCTAAVKVA